MSSIPIDFALSEDGDLTYNDDSQQINETKDTALLIQSTLNRIKSIQVDWFYDHIGADMEQLVGEDNTQEVAIKGKLLIEDCLTKDGFLTKEQLWIEVSPYNIYTLFYIVLIHIAEGDTITLQIDLALSTGINAKVVS